MNITKYTLNDRVVPQCIHLGKVGEYGVTKIVFNYSTWKEKYGEGSLEIVALPPNSNEYYPVIVSHVEDTIEWVISSSDTAVAGYGRIELRYYVEDGLKKSLTINTKVLDTPFDSEGETPEPIKDWIDDANKTLHSAEKAIEEIPESINSALKEAKESGIFDGKDGYTPQKGIDYFTSTEMNQFSDDVSTGAKGTFKTYYDEQKRLFDSNATSQHDSLEKLAGDISTEFDSHAVGKTSQFDAFTERKVTEFDANVTEKTNAFNQSAQQKKQVIEGIKTNVERELEDTKSQIFESNVKILKRLDTYDEQIETKVEGGRVIPISNSVDIAQVYETAGCPEYIGSDNLSKYSSFGLTESGWYLFARINSRYGESVSEGFSIVGASGFINPSIGNKYVDIAVRFGVIAESQKVIINWGASSETFVFKATDLAIRNLDYRVTFYLYNIDDYCEWEYELTTDAKFVKNKGYYKLIDEQYVKQEVTIDEAIPANIYYCHKSLVIKDFTRNMSYTLDTTVDCPVTIHLPEVGGDNYGAWFEVQMNFLAAYSVTVVPSPGQKVSANGVNTPKVGINIVNILYHKPTNTWLPTLTNWKVSES